MSRPVLKLVATALAGSICLLCCHVTLSAPFGQTPTATKQTPDPVTRLLAAVSTTAKLKRGMTGERMDAFLALADRNGDIMTATDRVKRARLEPQAVSALMKMIRGKRASKNLNDQLACANAAFALGQFGAKAKAALPLLKELEQHENQFTVGEASEAWKKIQGH